MLACLALIRPLDISTGERVEVCAASANDRRITGLGGRVWEPAMVTPPSLGISLWNGDFTDSVSVGGATLPINMNVLKVTYPFADDCAWAGAPVEIYAAEPGAAWPWPLRLSGKVSGLTRKANTLSLTIEVDGEPFKAKVLGKTYAGTGGAEGPTGLKERVKPLVIGWALNVEPVLIDTDNSVYQFTAYGPMESVMDLFERGSSFGAAVADYATYAALVAATIAPGKWASCLAEGMIRLGAPAYGVITGDIRGHRIGATTPRLTGAVISALASIAGVDAALLNKDSLDALDRAAPYPININLTDQTAFIDIAQSLALCCNAQSGIDFDGTFMVTRIAFGSVVDIALDAKGQTWPQVTTSEEANVSVPYWKTTIGANRNWRVQTADEIAFNAPIIDRGRYAAGTTYREGNYVNLADGSEWLYIATTAAAGNAPPTWPTTSNAWWVNKSPPTKAQDITFNDGQNVEGLKPAEVNATSGAPIGTPVGTITAADVSGTINSGGGVANNQVATPAIQDVAVTKTSYATLSSAVTLVDATDTDIFSLTVTKDIAGSLMRIEACVITESADDIKGYFTIYDTGGYVSQVYNIQLIGVDGDMRLPLTMFGAFSGIPAGSNTYKFKFHRTGGADWVRAMAQSAFSIREEKK